MLWARFNVEHFKEIFVCLKDVIYDEVQDVANVVGGDVIRPLNTQYSGMQVDDVVSVRTALLATAFAVKKAAEGGIMVFEGGPLILYIANGTSELQDTRTHKKACRILTDRWQ